MRSSGKPKAQKLAKLTAEQRATLDQIEADAIANFEGQVDELESALGMLRVGHHFGWKVIYIIHSKRTVRHYEEILGGIKVREMFPDQGPSAYRVRAMRMLRAASNFWKVVSGEAEDVRITKEDRRVGN